MIDDDVVILKKIHVGKEHECCCLLDIHVFDINQCSSLHEVYMCATYATGYD